MLDSGTRVKSLREQRNEAELRAQYPNRLMPRCRDYTSCCRLFLRLLIFIVLESFLHGAGLLKRLRPRECHSESMITNYESTS
ncbi:hypothetical protein BDV10DRAFT_161615 [Aspergillus recurvatus]